MKNKGKGPQGMTRVWHGANQALMALWDKGGPYWSLWSRECVCPAQAGKVQKGQGGETPNTQ